MMPGRGARLRREVDGIENRKIHDVKEVARRAGDVRPAICGPDLVEPAGQLHRMHVKNQLPRTGEEAG
jgi:hypothetical protein